MKILPLNGLLLLYLALPSIGLACTCVPPQESVESMIRSSVEEADIVFRGKIIAHEGDEAIFQVQEQWKGSLKSYVKLEWRRGDRGDCNGFWPDDLKVGSELLVFAIKGYFGTYRTSICRPTSQVSKAEAKLRALGPGKPPVK